MRLPQLFAFNGSLSVAALFLCLALVWTTHLPPQEAFAESNASEDAFNVALAETRCQDGDARACFELGDHIQFDLGNPKNTTDADPYFKRACDGGLGEACFRRYLNYLSTDIGWLKGDYSSLPPEYSSQALTKACDGNYGYGCHVLGESYRDGVMFAQDYDAAAVAFERGCVAEVEESCVALARLYSQGVVSNVTQDAVARANRLACGAGDAVSCPQEHNAAGSLLDAVRKKDVDRLSGMLKQGAVERVSKTEMAKALNLAAQNGNRDIVKLLIGAGVDINAPSPDENTALHHAASHGHAEIVHDLLSAGAEIDARGYNHITALYAAAGEGQADIAGILLSAGAEVDAKTKGGWTPLLHATFENHMNVVSVLLAHGAEVELAAEGGSSPLILAIKKRFIEVARTLLAAGANANALDSSGSPVLYYAANAGDTEGVRALLDAGARPEVKASNGWPPINAATYEGHYDVVVLLLDNGADVNQPTDNGSTPLIVAVQQKQDRLVELLLERGADPTLIDNNGSPAAAFTEDSDRIAGLLSISTCQTEAQVRPHMQSEFLAAAGRGDAKRLRQYLTCGVDVDTRRSSNGTTALMSAAERGDVAVVSALVSAAANLDLPDDEGKSALHYASANNHADAVRLLLGAGAKVDAKDKLLMTPLYFAAIRGNADVASVLMRGGASADLTIEFGWTPLHAAAAYGKADVIKVLLDNGATPDRPAKYDGDTALSLAAYQGSAVSVAALLAAGANPAHKINSGQSVIDLAKTSAVLKQLQAAQLSGISEADRSLATTLSIASKRQVCQLQEGLTLLGYEPGRLDGIAGQKVRNAVLSFLEDKDIPETASIDAIHAAVISEWMGSDTLAHDALSTSIRRPPGGTILQGRKNGQSPLVIETPEDGSNYYIKLVDPQSGYLWAGFFVRGGEPVRVPIYLGDHELRYATGDTFFGPNCLFGSSTRYARLDTLLHFSIENGEAIGNRITLIPQIGGNLSETQMSEDGW